MKIYSVFADIGSHSDGWEPEDETDVRFLGTFTTKTERYGSNESSL